MSSRKNKSRVTRKRAGIFVLSAFCFVVPIFCWGQANLPVYTDRLVNGFQNWGWGTLNLANTATVHSGANAVSLTGTAWNVALGLHHSGLDSSPYGSISFWAHGGPSGGQILKVYAHVNGADTAGTILTALPANAWRQFTIALTSLGADSKTNFEQVTLQLTSNGTTNTVYIDDVAFIAKPAPALVHLNFNANQTVRTADA